MAEEYESGLASGNRVRVTRFAVEVVGPNDERLTVFDQQDIASYRREDTILTLRRMSGDATELEFTSINDAGTFESALRQIREATLPVRTETMVKTYAGQDDYQADARRLARDGWRVTNTMERNPPIGCLRGCLLGLLALVWRPKPELVVTYERQIH